MHRNATAVYMDFCHILKHTTNVSAVPLGGTQVKEHAVPFWDDGLDNPYNNRGVKPSKYLTKYQA
jgi:hypothetical protein